MTTILEEYNTSFKFYDDLDKNEFTIIKVNVQKKKYENEQLFYYVNYEYEYSSNSDRAKNSNPLITLGDEDEIYDGEIICANEMTDSLIKYLLMSYEDMDGHIGNTTPQRYKYNIMENIKQLWD